MRHGGEGGGGEEEGYLGAAWALRRDAHVRVDVFYGLLGPRAKAWVNLVGTLLFLIPFCLFVLSVSWPSVRNSWAVFEVSPDPDSLPRYPIKSDVLVAFVLLGDQGVSVICSWLRHQIKWRNPIGATFERRLGLQRGVAKSSINSILIELIRLKSS